MFSRRPKIAVEAPPEAVPGRPFKARVLLRSRKRIDLAALRVSLEGRENVYTTGLSCVVFSESVALSGPAPDLPPGLHAFPFELALPATLPASAVGRGATTGYRLRVHGELANGVRLDRSFALTVAPASSVEPPGQLAPFEAQVEGVGWGSGRISGSLAGSVFRAGDVIECAVTVATPFAGQLHQVVVSLVQLETYASPGGDAVDSSHPVASTQVTLSDGEPAEVQLEIPTWISPSARAPSWDLGWIVEVTFDAQREVCRLPITIVRPGPARESMRFRGARSFSAELGAIWQAVGREVGLALEGGVLVGRARAVSVRVHRERRGGALYLVGALSYPPLGLELDIGSARRRDRTRADVPLGFSLWDQEHRAQARDRDQALLYLNKIERPLKALPVVAMGDESALTEQRIWSHERHVVGSFAWRVQDLARAIDAAFDHMPPPTELAPHLAEWKELTLLLDGTLDLARMAVIGRYRGNEVEIRTQFGLREVPAATRLLFRPRGGLDPRGHGPRWSLPEDRVRLLTMVHGAYHVAASSGALTVELPPVTARPASLLQILHILDEICATVAVASAPYR
jgi:hypothetical protein